MTGRKTLRNAVAVVVVLGASAGAAQEPRPDARCPRYAAAWSEALGRFGRDGLGADFVARHEAFLASGCRTGRDVCPRSPEEVRIADALTVSAMNAGRASTFLPFACPR